MSAVPASVSAVAEIIGLDAALRLADGLPPMPSKPWMGHAYVPQPDRLHPEHVLVAVLGDDDARALAAAFAGEILHLSKCRSLSRAARNRRIDELRAQGLRAREIAAEIGASAEVVKKVLQARRR
jgi:hypothetical protein